MNTYFIIYIYIALNRIKARFTSMLLKLYGTEDLSEVPSETVTNALLATLRPQRLRFFWQQADQERKRHVHAFCFSMLDVYNIHM